MKSRLLEQFNQPCCQGIQSWQIHAGFRMLLFAELVFLSQMALLFDLWPQGGNIMAVQPLAQNKIPAFEFDIVQHSLLLQTWFEIVQARVAFP